MSLGYVLRGMIIAITMAASPIVLAFPNVANSTQKGSLLILPKISVHADTTTLIHLSNDGDVSAQLDGYYVNRVNAKTRLSFALAAHASMVIDVKTGWTSRGFTTPSFPFDLTEESQEGELLIWVTDSSGSSLLRHNHLSARVTLVDFVHQTAFDYQGLGFFCQKPNPAGTLPLNGSVYNMAPKYLVAQIMPKGTALGLSNGAARVNRNRISLATTNQTLDNGYTTKVTQLNFDVWNANEVKFGNASRCAGSTFATDLEPVTDSGVPGTYTANPMVNGSNFLRDNLGTDSALIRIHGRSAKQCNRWHIASPETPLIPASYTASIDTGLVGVLETEIEINGDIRMTGHALSAAGQLESSIVYDLDDPSE